MYLYVCTSACVSVRVPVCASVRVSWREPSRCAWSSLTDCPPLQDSYLLDYFFSLNRYFEVGAPVYFVTTGGFNFSSTEGMNSICSSAGCDSSSLSQKIQHATKFPEQ